MLVLADPAGRADTEEEPEAAEAAAAAAAAAVADAEAADAAAVVDASSRVTDALLPEAMAASSACTGRFSSTMSSLTSSVRDQSDPGDGWSHVASGNTTGASRVRTVLRTMILYSRHMHDAMTEMFRYFWSVAI